MQRSLLLYGIRRDTHNVTDLLLQAMCLSDKDEIDSLTHWQYNAVRSNMKSSFSFLPLGYEMMSRESESFTDISSASASGASPPYNSAESLTFLARLAIVVGHRRGEDRERHASGRGPGRGRVWEYSTSKQVPFSKQKKERAVSLLLAVFGELELSVDGGRGPQLLGWTRHWHRGCHLPPFLRTSKKSKRGLLPVQYWTGLGFDKTAYLANNA